MNEPVSNAQLKCCFKACSGDITTTMVTLSVSHTDEGESVLHAHQSCLDTRIHAGVKYDDPKDHGHIPKNAKCVFCGDPLPWIGLHPYSFDEGDYDPPHRFWAHAQCMKAMLTSEDGKMLP